MTTINGWGGTVAAPSDSYEEQLIREQKLLNDMAALVVVEEAAAAQKSVPVQRAMVPAVTRAPEAAHFLPPASHRPAYASAPVRPATNERASLYSYVIDYSLDKSFLAQRPDASVDEITRKKKMDLVSLLKGACASN